MSLSKVLTNLMATFNFSMPPKCQLSRNSLIHPLHGDQLPAISFLQDYTFHGFPCQTTGLQTENRASCLVLQALERHLSQALKSRLGSCQSPLALKCRNRH